MALSKDSLNKLFSYLPQSDSFNGTPSGGFEQENTFRDIAKKAQNSFLTNSLSNPNIDPQTGAPVGAMTAKQHAVKDSNGNITNAKPGDISKEAVGGMQKLNNFAGSWKGSLVSAALDITGNLIKNRPEYSGTKGHITKAMDSAYDSAQKVISKVPGWGQAASMIMGAGKVLNKAVGRLGGGTDGMTTADAVLGSNFLGLTPLGLINGFGGRKAYTYTRNNELDKSTNGAFQGFLKTEDVTGIGAGKKYGLFSSGARDKQNQLTEFTTNMKHTISGIVDTNDLNVMAIQGSTPFIAQQQQVDLSGGIQQMRAARQGMQFSRRVVSKYTIGNKLRRSIKVLDVATNKYVEIPLNLDKDQIKGRKPIRLYNGTAVFMNGDGTVTSDRWETLGEREHLTPKGQSGMKLSPQETGEEPIDYMNDGTPLYMKGDGTIGPIEELGKDNLFQLIEQSNANFAKRLRDPNRKAIKLPDGKWGNFKLSWSEDEYGVMVYPEIQEINGKLVDLSSDRDAAWKSAVERKDYVYFPSREAAEWFTTHYKQYYKGFDKEPESFKQDEHEYLTPKGQGGIKTQRHWRKPANWSEEKIPYNEWIKDINPEYLNPNYDLELAYKYLPKEQLERWKFGVNSNNPKYYSEYKDSNGDYIYHLGSVVQIPNSEDYIFLKKGTEKDNPELHFETDMYYNGENGLKPTHSLSYEGDRYYYRRKPNFRSGEFIQNGNIVSGFKKGGQMNVIPEGALHARLNHLDQVDPELAKNTTKKGIPVITQEDGGEIIQHAEIEHSEIIFTLEVTNKLEKLRKDGSDEAAIEAGKLLVQEILHNTDDRTNLIAQI